MGLLDQVLGGLTGNVSGRSPMGDESAGGMSSVVAALLPVVLGMLANRQGSTGGSAFSALGGLGGGGAGGLGGLLEQLTRSGYGQQADSWVGTGRNEPLAPQAWSDVLGPGRLAEIAARAGLSDEQTRQGLSELMPEVVDRLTPEGRMPAQDRLLASIDDFEQRMSR
jgi:uncharacterized protein YidB (DUF937 family)